MTASAAENFDQILLPEALTQSALNYGGRPAMEFLGRVWSYRGLARLVDAAAHGLQALGVTPGTKVGLCLPNTPYSVILYYAVLKIGGVVVNYNPLYTLRELEHQVRDSGTTIMAVPDMPQFQDKASRLAEQGLLTKVIACSMAEAMGPMKGLLYRLARAKDISALPQDGRHVAFRQLVAGRGRPAPVDLKAADLGVLQYTGGTTGTPKGVMLTQGNIAANARQTLSIMEDMRFGEERLVAVLPLFHVFAMTSVMNCAILSASELLLLPRFELQSLLKLIHTRRATIMHAVPTVFGAINGAAADHVADLSSIKYCISGGAPLPAEVGDRFRELTGAALVEGYGLSEASPVVCCNPAREGGNRPGSVGLPLPATVIEVRDLQDPHKLLPPGERGEVTVRGPQVMAGYWNRPEDTAEVFVDGALRTGDVGYLDEDGYLYLVDRIKDMIIASGFKVYPRIIEEALYRHPAVREAIVVGAPDEYRGQAPVAYVSLQPGSEASPETLEEFLAGEVSKIEMPREIRIRPELPKTAIGKPSKKDLIIQEGLGPASSAPTS